MGGELVLVSTCLTITPLITGGQEHTQTHTHIPTSSVHSGNLAHDKDFSALEDSTEKDIFPPPARRPTRNSAPPKSGATRTQLGKEGGSALTAKAIDTTKKEQACDAKKRASDGLKVGCPAHGLPSNFFLCAGDLTFCCF